MAYDSSKPANNELLDNVASVIRANQDAVETTIAVDHNSMGTTNDGKHKQVTLPELATKPDASGTTDVGYVYTKNDGSKTELFFEDEDANEVQITKGGSPLGGADVFCVFDGSTAGANPKTLTPSNSRNVTNVTRTAKGSFTVNFTTALTDANYTATVFAKGSSASHVAFVDTMTKAAGTLSFTLKDHSFTTSATNTFNGTDINVVVFRES